MAINRPDVDNAPFDTQHDSAVDGVLQHHPDSAHAVSSRLDHTHGRDGGEGGSLSPGKTAAADKYAHGRQERY